MKICGTYAIVHCESGRCYVGASQDIVRRWRTHIYRLSRSRHFARALQELWTQDGPEAFTFAILERCHIEDLALVEQRWLDAFECLLNTHRSVRAPSPTLDPIIAAKGAATRTGMVFTDERRARIREAVKAAWARKSTEQRRRSDEARRRTSETLRQGWQSGRWKKVVTPEQRARISAALTGRVHHSAETRAKISAGTRAGIARRKAKVPA